MYEPRTQKPVEVAFPDHGLFIAESHHADDFRMDWTAHPFFKLLYLLEGSASLRAEGGQSLHLDPHSFVTVPAGARHRLEDDTGKPAGLIVLCLQERLIDLAGPPLRPRLSRLRHWNQPLRVQPVRHLLREMLVEQTLQRTGYETVLLSATLQLLVHLLRASESGETATLAAPGAHTSRGARVRVQAYAEDLARTFHRPDTLDQAAARCGLSRRRFSELFREITGQSWLQYVRRLRLEHATLLLCETGDSVASVAFASGFEDLSNFYRAFQRAYGRPPERYRRERAGR